MKYLSTFVLIAAVLVGCSKASTPVDSNRAKTTSTAGYPTLIIDSQHQIRGEDTPPAYQIVAALGIRLSVGDFHFTYGTNVITPNMVQLVRDNSAYRLSRPTETNVYLIDNTTMEAVKGEQFPGFRSGDHIMLAIGRSTNGSDKEEFKVSWVGQIEVK